MGNGADRTREPLAPRRDEPPCDRHRGRERDLLAEHRPHSELVRIDVPGHPPARRRPHQPPEHRVASKRVDDRTGVVIEVEQPADRALCRRQVGRAVEREAGLDVAVRRPQLDDAGAVGEAQAAAVGTAENLLDARDGARPEEPDQALALKRRPVGELGAHVDETAGRPEA